MIPYKHILIAFRADGRREEVHVVELGFRTFLNCCGAGTYDTDIAEASVRRSSSAGVFDLPVPPGFLDLLDDDSAAALVSASNELNLTAKRAKKALELIVDRRARISSEETGNGGKTEAIAGMP